MISYQARKPSVSKVSKVCQQRGKQSPSFPKERAWPWSVYVFSNNRILFLKDIESARKLGEANSTAKSLARLL